jgi:hypothetical protein
MKVMTMTGHECEGGWWGSTGRGGKGKLTEGKEDRNTPHVHVGRHSVHMYGITTMRRPRIMNVLIQNINKNSNPKGVGS